MVEDQLDDVRVIGRQELVYTSSVTVLLGILQILEHLAPKTAVPSLCKRDYPKTNSQTIMKKTRMNK